MATCRACGSDVTGKKFCQECGTPVAPDVYSQAAPAMTTCPRCNGEVKASASFCMHCGTSLKSNDTVTATGATHPSTHFCPACHTEVPIGNAFCTNCGQDLNAPAAEAAAMSYCVNCGHPNGPGVSFCNACGHSMAHASGAPASQYGQYGQPQYPQPYGQQYGQGSYQQPMIGQPPMVLRCPVCMAMSPVGASNCPGCHTSLAGVVPTPANMPVQGQGGLGGFMQGDGGKYAMGALGGAAAVLGGEMLLHGLERDFEGNRGYRHRDEGLLGELGNDLGLF